MLKGVALAYTAREKRESNFSCSPFDIVSVNFAIELFPRGVAFFNFFGPAVSLEDKSRSQSVASDSVSLLFCLSRVRDVLGELYLSFTDVGQLIQFSICVFILDPFFAIVLEQNLHFTLGPFELWSSTFSNKVLTGACFRPGILLDSVQQSRSR